MSYWQLYLLVVGYFALLYFVLGPVFLAICKLLAKKNKAHIICDKPVSKNQKRKEMLYSTVSILIFGFSVFPIVYLARANYITFLDNTILNILGGVALLTIWNEVHFYCVHRLMHTKLFYQKVHIIHHQSIVPTVQSVYSFHWIEAVLLSTVPLTIVPFIPFSTMAIALYPLASILLNYAGHCNYRIGKGEGAAWTRFGTNHNYHHSKFTQNFGFASHLLDACFSKLKNRQK